MATRDDAQAVAGGQALGAMFAVRADIGRSEVKVGMNLVGMATRRSRPGQHQVARREGKQKAEAEQQGETSQGGTVSHVNAGIITLAEPGGKVSDVPEGGQSRST
ncbi:hypothetical protein [Halomonas campaniensis]|uniref:hypothetical protein n=1 Tax=Halomonas campaniensis TaxID=213554 RepID=UPI0035631E10